MYETTTPAAVYSSVTALIVPLIATLREPVTVSFSKIETVNCCATQLTVSILENDTVTGSRNVAISGTMSAVTLLYTAAGVVVSYIVGETIYAVGLDISLTTDTGETSIYTVFRYS